MSIGPIVATPQLYTADDLADVLRADFADRSVNVTVEVDVWAPETMRGEPRVTIEMGDGTIGEPAGHYQPGAWWPVNVRAAGVSSIASTLDPASTIAPTLSGTPTVTAAMWVRFVEGGTIGTPGAIYQLSYDGGATWIDYEQLLDALTIPAHGATITLGSAGAIVTAGDVIRCALAAAYADLARPILDDAQTFVLSIHAPADTKVATVNSARNARNNTTRLLHTVTAAVRRQLASPLRAAMRVTWPTGAIEGWPAFVYGSLCRVSLIIASPVLDDAQTQGHAVEVDATVAAQFPDGSDGAAEPIAYATA